MRTKAAITTAIFLAIVTGAAAAMLYLKAFDETNQQRLPPAAGTEQAPPELPDWDITEDDWLRFMASRGFDTVLRAKVYRGDHDAWVAQASDMVARRGGRVSERPEGSKPGINAVIPEEELAWARQLAADPYGELQKEPAETGREYSSKPVLIRIRVIRPATWGHFIPLTASMMLGLGSAAAVGTTLVLVAGVLGRTLAGNKETPQGT